MISFRELVKNPEVVMPSMDILVNLYRLQYCLNYIRVLRDVPMAITSGLRSQEDHFRIYQTINASRRVRGLPPIMVPTKSMHLIGAAADVGDPDQSFKEWIVKNNALCQELHLSFENFAYTPTWVHVQVYPPRSGEMFFKPY